MDQSNDDLELLSFAKTEFTLNEEFNINPHIVGNYEEVYNCMEADLNATISVYICKDNADRCEQEHAFEGLLNAVVEKNKKLEAMQNILEQNRDYKHLAQFYETKTEELKDLYQKFGDDISTTDTILTYYMEHFQFKIMSVECVYEDPNIQTVTIQFIINGQLDIHFPVELDIDVINRRVVDIQTEIYQREKLLPWLKDHSVTILGLIRRLQKTFINNFYKNML